MLGLGVGRREQDPEASKDRDQTARGAGKKRSLHEPSTSESSATFYARSTGRDRLAREPKRSESQEAPDRRLEAGAPGQLLPAIDDSFSKARGAAAEATPLRRSVA